MCRIFSPGSLKSSGVLINGREGNLFGVKNDLFLAGQLFLHLRGDQGKVSGVSHVINVIRRDCQHRAEGEIGDPGFVLVIQAGQVIGGDGPFIVAPTPSNALDQGGNRSSQVNDQIRWGQKFYQGLI